MNMFFSFINFLTAHVSAASMNSQDDNLTKDNTNDGTLKEESDEGADVEAKNQMLGAVLLLMYIPFKFLIICYLSRFKEYH